MKTYHRWTEPCVIVREGQDTELHVAHGTEARARRNAALASVFGYRYHDHPCVRRTLFGVITGAPRVSE